MAFKLVVVSRDDSLVLMAGQGEATSRTFVSPGQVLFDAILGGGWSSQTVLLDMEAVPFIDSTAIGWLINSQKQFRSAGGQLILHSVAPAVRNVLNLLKIERVVSIAEDLVAAQAMVTAVESEKPAAPKKARAKAAKKTKAVSAR